MGRYRKALCEGRLPGAYPIKGKYPRAKGPTKEEAGQRTVLNRIRSKSYMRGENLGRSTMSGLAGTIIVYAILGFVAAFVVFGLMAVIAVVRFKVDVRTAAGAFFGGMALAGFVVWAAIDLGRNQEASVLAKFWPDWIAPVFQGLAPGHDLFP